MRLWARRKGGSLDFIDDARIRIEGGGCNRRCDWGRDIAGFNRVGAFALDDHRTIDRRP